MTRLAAVLAVLAVLLAATGCTTVGQVTTLGEPACRQEVASALAKILEAQGESPPVAAQLAETTTYALQWGLGPRPFVVASPSGTDYGFFVQPEDASCLLRLYGRQKGFVSYTNNLTYIATEPLPSCKCAS